MYSGSGMVDPVVTSTICVCARLPADRIVKQLASPMAVWDNTTANTATVDDRTKAFSIECKPTNESETTVPTITAQLRRNQFCRVASPAPSFAAEHSTQRLGWVAW